MSAAPVAVAAHVVTVATVRVDTAVVRVASVTARTRRVVLQVVSTQSSVADLVVAVALHQLPLRQRELSGPPMSPIRPLLLLAVGRTMLLLQPKRAPQAATGRGG